MALQSLASYRPVSSVLQSLSRLDFAFLFFVASYLTANGAFPASLDQKLAFQRLARSPQDSRIDFDS